MKYREVEIPNKGYTNPEVGHLAEIDGLDNRNQDGLDLRFEHLGYDRSVLDGVDVRWAVERGGPSEDKLALIGYEGDTMVEGVEVLEDDVIARLVSGYGWASEAYMTDGRPIRLEVM